MSEFIFCVRWMLMLFLLVCTSTAVQRRFQLKPCFAPIITVCSIALVVYLGGILGQLRPVAYTMVLACGVCACFVAVRVYRQFSGWYSRERWLAFPVVEVLFLGVSLCFASVLLRSELVHYDNFTHWALVVKEMLITHAFPTTDSVLIEFTNYPTGTASWIYFVCTVVGAAESSMIMAQGVLIFCALYAILGIVQERGRFLLFASLGTGLSLLSLFNYAVRINNLLVDFVLPVLALAAIAFIYRHRRAPRSLLVGVVPILGLLVVVKSSGIIFATVAFVYLLYVVVCYIVAQGKGKERSFGIVLLAKTAASIACCVLPLVLWNLRVKSVFSGVSNKFETDLTQIDIAVGGKTQAEIAQICSLFLETLMDVSQRATIGILLFHLLAIVASIVAYAVLKKKWALPKVLLLMDVVLVAYLLGILAMYVFSMPIAEASNLAAFERYASSIVVLFGGVLSICFVIDMEASFYYRLGEVENIRSFKSVTSKSYYCNGALGCVVALCLILTSEFNGMHEQYLQEQNALPQAMQQVVGDNWASEVDDAKYLVLASDTDAQVTGYYAYYVARYYLRANNVDVICMFYEDAFLSLLAQYDYLVIVEESQQAQTLMQAYFQVSGEPGVYDLSNIN